jgi:hypothetical protein
MMQEKIVDVPIVFSSYRLTVGVTVPLAIVLIGALGKKISRGGGGWEREDVYAGTDLTLAGMTGILVNLAEYLKAERTTIGSLDKKLLGGNLSMLLIGFIAYQFTLSFKQDYGPKSNRAGWKQLCVMAGVSNLLGFLTLFAALVLMAP